MAGRESCKAMAGSIKCVPCRHIGKPAPARRWRRHLHRRYKGIPKMSNNGDSISEESRTESEPYETGE